MGSLILLRHAKSSWADGATGDHERPLNARGQRDAGAVAAALLTRERATHVLCSTAIRTRQTLQHLVRAGAVDEACARFEAELYLASAKRIERSIDAAADAGAHLLVIGHNPGIEELASRLAGHRLVMKTSSLCRFDRDATATAWRLVEQLVPRG